MVQQGSDTMRAKQGLIGKSEERCSLKREQDREYELSLEEDRQKRLFLERANIEAEHKKRAQEARVARVAAEPDADFVTVRVRHLTMGVCSRCFPTNSLVAAVYNWVGSLTPDIVHFALCDPLGTPLPQSRKVEDRCNIVMATAPHTPSSSESDEDIQLLGFGDAHDDINRRQPDCQTNSSSYQYCEAQ